MRDKSAYIDLIAKHGLKAWSIYHPAEQKLKRGFGCVTAGVSRSLLYRRPKDFTAIYTCSLSKGAIRLLTILDTDHTDGTLHCRLDTYPEGLAPRYDAVSYCWGDEADTTTIICNGFRLQIRANLMAFLRASGDRKTPSRPLWIDAICLNQEDDVEKNLQVPLMSSIYQHASRTIVWLGEPDIDTDDALMWLTKIMPVWRMEKTRQGLTETEAFNGHDRKIYARQLKALNEYVSRPWFNRLWCLQEVMLSQDIHILSHTQNFPFLCWKRLCRYMQMVPKGLIEFGKCFELEDFRLLDQLDYVVRGPVFMEYFRKSMQTYGPVVLGTLGLRFFAQGRTCREPVDRVWGTLGLLQRKFVNLVREADIIDYSEDGKRDYWKSYLSFLKVLYAYDAKECLELILDELGRGRHESLPSWCPDFDRANRYLSFSWSRKSRAGFINKGDGTKIDSTLSSDGTLSILGFQIDAVTHVTPVWQMVDPIFLNDNPEETRQICGAMHEWLRCCRKLWDTTSKHANEGIKSLCCTLLAADGQYQKGLTYSSEWLQFHETLEASVAAVARGDTEEETNHGQAYSEYRSILMNACDGRSAFATEGGRFGMGPPDLQEGDVICTIMGARPLFVLREMDADSTQDVDKLPDSSSKFQLVGDAYVYGLMFGEAFTAPERGPEQYFPLV